MCVAIVIGKKVKNNPACPFWVIHPEVFRYLNSARWFINYNTGFYNSRKLSWRQSFDWTALCGASRMILHFIALLQKLMLLMRVPSSSGQKAKYSIWDLVKLEYYVTPPDQSIAPVTAGSKRKPVSGHRARPIMLCFAVVSSLLQKNVISLIKNTRGQALSLMQENSLSGFPSILSPPHLSHSFCLSPFSPLVFSLNLTQRSLMGSGWLL